MPQPQEKTPDGITELPNPELNPLLNPMLGRNLGRWAEVYFTSPPEKREEAVGELLRELKRPKSSPGPSAPCVGITTITRSVFAACAASLSARKSGPRQSIERGSRSTRIHYGKLNWLPGLKRPRCFR